MGVRREYPFAGVAPKVTDSVALNEFYMTLARESQGFCHQLASYVRIVPDGSVYPCCRGSEGFLKMGNIFERSFDEIWNGEEYQRLREEFLTGRLRRGCDTCTLSGRGNL